MRLLFEMKSNFRPQMAPFSINSIIDVENVLFTLKLYKIHLKTLKNANCESYLIKSRILLIRIWIGCLVWN